MRNESVMKWNEKERKRKESESYPGMIGNDCENDRKRLQYLPSVLPLRGMDSSEIPLFSVHFPQKNTPGAESTEGYGYSLSSVVSFFGNIGGILLSTKTIARLITVVTPIAIAALS